MTERVDVLLITASPSGSSRSGFALSALGQRLTARGLAVKQVSVHDLPAEDVLRGRSDTPEIAALLARVKDARALVLATPVYKAVYAGALKAVVDLIPPDGLEHKAVLGLASARIEAHGASVSGAFDHLFAFFKNAHALPTLFFQDAEIASHEGRYELGPSASERLDRAAAQLFSALS